MRKVTASAVILTALTGCGQNSGMTGTQWSFEIPSEDEISSLELGHDTGAVADAALVSTVNSPVRSYGDAADTFAPVSTGASAGDMMGPAFSQPSDEVETLNAGSSASSSLDPALSNLENYSSVPSARSAGAYQPVAVRPDPVAQIKTFLGATGSPSALTNRAPYRSNVMMPALPAVYLPSPASSVTATLGDPMGIESQLTAIGDQSFTSVGLPVVESAIGGMYGAANNSSTVALAQPQPIYQATAAPEVATVSASVESLSYASPTNQSQSPATAENGLPALEPRNPAPVSIGTAILQDLQANQSTPALPAQANAGDGIDIEIMPAEAAESESDLVASNAVEPSVANDAPTLESLSRSMVIREVSPLVAYASQAGDASLAVEALTLSNPPSDLPTLESLLETMPETAVQPNLAVDLPADSAASPLLEGLSSRAEPLSTLYMPIPSAASETSPLENSEDANLSTNVSLVRGSLSSFSDMLPTARTFQGSSDSSLVSSANQGLDRRTKSSNRMLHRRNKAILSLADKSSAKRRQLVTY